MSELEIIDLASPATIQDHGRRGFRRYGVPASGAIDTYALAEGQHLLGNSPDAAALEMPFSGGRFRAHGDVVIATSGARMAMDIDGKPTDWRSTVRLENGQVLTIGAASVGNYGYLHLPGGITCAKVMNSRATHAASGIGWQPVTGSRLRPASGQEPENKGLAQPEYFGQRHLRIMLGPQSRLFSEADHQLLVEGTFSTGFIRDRMGVRLLTETGCLDAGIGVKIISDPIMPGDIQVTADGVPTILLADAQPTGGYPRIATVIGADLPVIAQMQPGVEFKFRMVARDEAIEALRALHKAMARIPDLITSRITSPRNLRDLLAHNMISGFVRGDEDDKN